MKFRRRPWRAPLRAAAVIGALTLGAGAAEPVRGQEPGVGDTTGSRAAAYADAETRELLRQARIRRSMVDRRIEAYGTRVTERMSAGLGLGIGERLLYRRETVSQVNWTADTVRIDVLAAREVLPSFHPGVQVPSAVTRAMPSVVFDPVDSEMLLRLENTPLRHPLATNGEDHYRYAAGDSTVVRLPDGRSVRLRELRITPRRQSPELIAGSFWLDMETHAVVQAYFRLARPLDSRHDDFGGRAGALVPTRAELDYIAIDYGLWDLRWWLPRTVAAQGVFQLGPARVPLRFERRYDDYTVQGAAIDLATLPEQPGEIPPRPCRPRVSVSIVTGMGVPVDTTSPHWIGGTDTLQTVPRRTVAQRRAAREGAARGEGSAAADTAGVECDRVFIVSRPTLPELLESDLLPHDIYQADSPVLPSSELDELADRLSRIPGLPWDVRRPRLGWGLGDGRVRYNRVEGLSLAVQPRWDFGRTALDGEVRVGTAAGEVGVQAGVTRRGLRVESRLGLYRRLDFPDIAPREFGFGHTVSALLLGRDDRDYFRAAGAELVLRPAPVRPQWWDVRLFAERHASVAAETGFHVRRLLDGDRTVRPNIVAAAADQAGATLRLRAGSPGSATAPRWAGEVELHGETGDFTFARPRASLRAALPLGVRFAAGLEAAAGTTFGPAPLQRAWFLGGPLTLRGYDFGIASGASFWMTRAELSTGPPGYRFIAFGDLGWAGDRADFGAARPLRSAGFGYSILDGVVRLDVARAVQTRNWRLHLRIDGVL